MTAAPLPDNEQARLQALKDYEVLDTGAEASFDSIVTLASQLCQAPIALVSLVDTERQWFKAREGLGAQETHRDLAFCAHAIHQPTPLIVENALEDPRFKDNPLVLGEPNIRFYAGAPLITPEGFALGTLCVIDTKPRTLTEHQIKGLQALSSQVVSLLELRKKYSESVRLNEELIEKNQIIEEMAQHNKRFLANLNHEMRTPLNAIAGFSRRLTERVAKLDLPSYVGEGLQSITMASKHLNNLINDILDLSKADAGKMEFIETPFNPKTLLEEVTTINAVRAQEHNVDILLQLNQNLPDCVMSDERKISQVLINILSNAVKFTPDNKSVSVTADFVDSQLLVVISDQGVGISPENMEKIFDEFAQIPNSLSNRSKGTGLGLAIASRLTKILGGDIHVSSEVGKGTTFRMRFPTQDCSAIAPHL